jgi:iron-sulfur cluster repair protein YtfE (RIC family)
MQEDRIKGLDDTLARLGASVRAADHAAAMDLYLMFDGQLTRYVHGEERVLFPVLERFTSMPSKATASMRDEHRSLRRLADSLGEHLASRDTRGGLEILGALRSVLMLHMAKEDWVLQPLLRSAAV